MIRTRTAEGGRVAAVVGIVWSGSIAGKSGAGVGRRAAKPLCEVDRFARFHPEHLTCYECLVCRLGLSCDRLMKG